MKHTLRAKYAADGLSAHRQRVSHQPAMVKAMKDKAALAKITARLKSDGQPQIDFAKPGANLGKWYAEYMDKEVFKALTGLKTASAKIARPENPTADEIVARIKGRSADFVVMDDMGHDDKFDAMIWAPPRHGLSFGFDFAKPGTKDFGVIQVASTC